MIPTLTVLGFFLAVAWLQNYCFNRIIQTDLALLKATLDPASPPASAPNQEFCHIQNQATQSQIAPNASVET
jgi:hypothetical protein